MSRGMRRGKVFRLHVKPNVVLYDMNLQEVWYKEVLDDGTVVYELQGTWRKEVDAYVTRPYYMVMRLESPRFAVYISKMVCTSGIPHGGSEYYKCLNGRLVVKEAMSVFDKRFRELCELI